MLINLLNLIIILFVPFLMIGTIRKTKAFWGGKKGASIFQPFYDFIKLIKKDFVISSTTSCVFKIAPVIILSATFLSSLFVPLSNGFSLINIEAGLIIFSYTLALAKFFALISAMDTGSSFEGMGASREACFTSIVEPAFFVVIASIMALTNNLTFLSIKEVLKNAGIYGILIIVFAFCALFLMILIETSRVPFDDPATHLELTMVHEVMILDNSGTDFAILSYANSLKMLLLSSLILNLLIPQEISEFLHVGFYLIGLFVISILIGTIESTMARIRMSHIFEFVFIMNSLSLVVMALVASRMFGG